MRSGRAWATAAAGRSALIGLSPATAYVDLTADLAALRAALAADRPNDRSLVDRRRSYADLDLALARAIAHAFAADACGAPTPEGIASWAAEGLARSDEREVAIFAATDVCGLAQPAVSPNERWSLG